ncbi:MAG: hypothetical protein IT480_02355, partial [Gammaproteobacteria bacterium]|nr:hypothetical protein [Gammaproteobacteria bacterium]
NLTLPDLLAMVATEHDPERRRKIVQLAFVLGQMDGNNTAITAMLAKLNAQDTHHAP